MQSHLSYHWSYTVISKNVVADATRDSEITEAKTYHSHNEGDTRYISDAEDNTGSRLKDCVCSASASLVDRCLRVCFVSCLGSFIGDRVSADCLGMI